MMKIQNIEEELNIFNIDLKKSLSANVESYNEVLDYILNTKGKQIRPTLGILVAKMLGKFNDEQNKFLQSIELIHNATLFHDDIIDEAEIRHSNLTLHKKFSNKIAVLSGDYFLSVALKLIFNLNNNKINALTSDFMKKICEGEIEQNLTLNKLESIDNYLNKTKKKTALLFELTVAGISILSQNNDNYENIKQFGENFGIAFQLKDDLNNFKFSKDKPFNNDLESGVITAPVIFLAQEYDNIESLLEKKNYPEILRLLENSNAKTKTTDLINCYTKKAKDNLNCFENTAYKQTLLNLVSEF